MKRMLLFIAAGLMMMTTAQAKEISLKESNDFNTNNRRSRNVQPVLFTYDNVDYAIFPDGRVEFELPRRYARSAYHRRGNGRQYRVNYNANFRPNRRAFVRYNRYGQVSKIGNTRIFYNRRGKVAKIGQLRVQYRRGNLHRVGGLKVRYNRRGQIIAARGHVLVRDFYGHDHDCNDHNFGNFDRHQDDDNRDWDDGIYFKRGTK